jgi:hypothetical protein
LPTGGLQSERGEQARHDGQGRAPGEQAEDEATAGAEDLRRDEHEVVEESTEVHPQNLLALGLVFFRAVRVF